MSILIVFFGLGLLSELYREYRRGTLVSKLTALRPHVGRVMMIAAGIVLLAVGASRENLIAMLAGVVVIAYFAATWAMATRADLRDPTEARAILGLTSAATAADVQAAWRRLIAQVHPDHGGSAELASRVTAARDLLLARMEPR